MRTLILIGSLAVLPAAALTAQGDSGFTHADTLRGSIGPERAWWKVVFYDLNVRVTPRDSSIRGFNRISYRVRDWPREMQIDLMQPLEVDSMVQDGKRLSYRRDGDAFFVRMGGQRSGELKSVAVYYHGKPRAARKPPWDGGLIWSRDGTGNRWVATANEGLGASVWWPNKDFGLGRRARQPTRRDHVARSDGQHLERPSAKDHVERRRHHDARMVRTPSRSTTTTSR